MRCVLCRQSLTTRPPLVALLSIRPYVANRLCAACTVPLIRLPATDLCPDCGRPGTTMRCGDCQQWRDQGELPLAHRGLYQYNDAMREFIHRYKGMGDYRLHPAFWGDIQDWHRLRATFVPLTTEPGHFVKRGFDPVLGLFGGLPLQEWLVKDDTSAPQASKDRVSRLATPQSFRCVAPNQAFKKCRRICLLDDLYTTGRTLHHAANCLREAGYTGEIVSRSLIR